MTRPFLNPAAIVDVFNRYGVEYVVIGAFAARLHDAPIDPTFDIDFTPAKTYENSLRLDAALNELKAKIRIDAAPYALAFGHSPASHARPLLALRDPKDRRHGWHRIQEFWHTHKGREELLYL